MVQYQMSPRLLRIAGPAIEVSVNDRVEVALLDTGASVSSLDITFAQALQLPVSGTHRSTGATGGGDYPNFDASLHIPALEYHCSITGGRTALERARPSVGRHRWARHPLPVRIHSKRRNRHDTSHQAEFAVNDLVERSPLLQGLEILGIGTLSAGIGYALNQSQGGMCICLGAAMGLGVLQ